MKAFTIAFLFLAPVLLFGDKMVQVPSGQFKPFLKESLAVASKPVQMKAFYLDVYPITNQDYLVFVKSNPKWQKGKPSGIFVDSGYLNDWTKKNEFDSSRQSAPVSYVSWFAAKAYCESLGKRLPKESEWEYAASFPPEGGNKNDIEKKIMDWFGEKKPDQLPSVGRYKNQLGIYDLHGLIWEWVYDFNNSSVTGDSRQDSDIENGVFCGGGAIKAGDFSNYAAYMRFGHRAGLKGWYTGKYLGFRCAADKKI
jgi:formylglycine-generating enzyme required for sulfatase activity